MLADPIKRFKEIHAEMVALDHTAPEQAEYRREEMEWIWYQLSEEQREELRPLYLEQCK